MQTCSFIMEYSWVPKNSSKINSRGRVEEILFDKVKNAMNLKYFELLSSFWIKCILLDINIK